MDYPSAISQFNYDCITVEYPLMLLVGANTSGKDTFIMNYRQEKFRKEPNHRFVIFSSQPENLIGKYTEEVNQFSPDALKPYARKSDVPTTIIIDGFDVSEIHGNYQSIMYRRHFDISYILSATCPPKLKPSFRGLIDYVLWWPGRTVNNQEYMYKMYFYGKYEFNVLRRIICKLDKRQALFVDQTYSDRNNYDQVLRWYSPDFDGKLIKVTLSKRTQSTSGASADASNVESNDVES